MNNDLHEQLRRIREKIGRYRGSGINEEDTRPSLIDPLLSALGWDTTERDEVRRGFRLQSNDNPVDYALIILGKPLLFLEAKSLDSNLDDRKWSRQIMVYATEAGVGWIVLTDGNEYRIYNSHAKVPVDEKMFRRVRIEDDHARTLETLLLLSKESIQRDKMGPLWQVHHVDRKVRETLERLFTPEPDPSLISLIQGQVGDFSESDVKASLMRAQIRFEFPVEPEFTPLNALQQSMVARTRYGIPAPTTKRRYDVSLIQLIEAGLVKSPLQLEHSRNGQRLVAQLESNGTITWEGKRYNSPSGAGDAALTSVKGRTSKGANRSTDGWGFWSFKDHDGVLKALDVLRQRYLATSK